MSDCIDCGSNSTGWWRDAYPSGSPSGYATHRCRPCYNAKVRAAYRKKVGLSGPGRVNRSRSEALPIKASTLPVIKPCADCRSLFAGSGRSIKCTTCLRRSKAAAKGRRATTRRFSGRPARRLQAEVFGEETTCWICLELVDQALPYNDDMARSLDHVVPLVLGGEPYARENARLAHRLCNSARGVDVRA